MPTFFTPPVAGADLRAALVASCLRGALPPVDLRAVCLVRAMAPAGWVCDPVRLFPEGASVAAVCGGGGGGNRGCTRGGCGGGCVCLRQDPQSTHPRASRAAFSVPDQAPGEKDRKTHHKLTRAKPGPLRGAF